MQENREVIADLAETQGQQVCGGRPDDHEIPFLDRPAQEAVAHCAADQIDHHQAGRDLLSRWIVEAR